MDGKPWAVGQEGEVVLVSTVFLLLVLDVDQGTRPND